ncbi:MAG TPA: tyrosine-protein kinase, partial [Spongiibacteraceae bacterium]|nr:tyrosine-protein kinase [Spongiibacteraceae bacterium]
MSDPSGLKSEGGIKGDSFNDDELDLRYLLAILLENRWIIIATTVIGIVLATIYLKLANPIYRADVLIQIEKQSNGLAALGGMQDIFSRRNPFGGADAEIEIFKSRNVISTAVEKLELDVYAAPKYFPLIGGRMAAGFRPQKLDSDLSGAEAEEGRKFAEPFLGFDSYAWGGERINIFSLTVPDSLLDRRLTLRHLGEGQYSIFAGDREILQGRVGETASGGGVSLLVKELEARPGVEFVIVKLNGLRTIRGLQRQIIVEEQGRMSGVLKATLASPNPFLARSILQAVSEEYVRQNVMRLSAEAQNSLNFLREQLPQIKVDLETAEDELSKFRSQSNSVDIGIETKSFLEQLVKIENNISELNLRKEDLAQRFTPEHPSYIAHMAQLEKLKENRSALEKQISTLPDVQQRLLQLVRSVEVKTKLYTQLLARTQELDVVKAGTVGNVRIIDEAAVDASLPISPNRRAVRMLGLVLGFAAGVAFVLLRLFLKRGVESPEQIEALGMPVLASIPFSSEQSAKGAFGVKNVSEKTVLLATEAPGDLSIEALRSLRTSLHFAFIGSEKRVIALTGPSPGVGKSFVTANLGALLAQMGRKVVVVDADMRKGTLHKYGGVSASVGLSGILSGQVDLNGAVQHVSGFDLIARGEVPPNPSELLMGPEFSKLIDRLREEYDEVLIDTPPVLAVADALVVCGTVKTTLMVVRHGLNTLGEV